MAGLGIIATALSVAGGTLGAIGAIQQGQQEKAEAEQQALVLRQEAQEKRAIAGQQAREIQRQKKVLQSRQLSLAAAQGGAGDPSIVNAIADVEGEAEERFLTKQAQGDTAKQNLLYQADQTVRAGRAAARQRGFSAFSSLLEGATTGLETYRKYYGANTAFGASPSYHPGRSVTQPG